MVSDGTSSVPDGDYDPYAMDKRATGYYFIGPMAPELKTNRITALVNEMYYTNGGHLCLNMRSVTARTRRWGSNS